VRPAIAASVSPLSSTSAAPIPSRRAAACA
jgi:hypothetical protein